LNINDIAYVALFAAKKMQNLCKIIALKLAGLKKERYLCNAK
jgi:hypothetical protein